MTFSEKVKLWFSKVFGTTPPTNPPDNPPVESPSSFCQLAEKKSRMLKSATRGHAQLKKSKTSARPI